MFRKVFLSRPLLNSVRVPRRQAPSAQLSRALSSNVRLCAMKPLLRSASHQVIAIRGTSIRQLSSSSELFAVKPLILSDIGEGTRDVEIISWLVKEGDEVSAWDDIVEVQSDKASVNIQTANDGKIAKIHWEEGDTVKVGAALVDIDYFGEAEEAAPAEATPETAPEVTVKATPAVKALAAKMGIDLTTLTGSGAGGRITKEDVEKAGGGASSSVQSSGSVQATPKVRGYAKSQGVDLADIIGSGKDGRITEADIDAFLAGPATPAPAAAAPAFELKAVDLSGLKEAVVKKLSPIQRAMVSSMKQANTIPHFGYSEEYDMSALVAMRKQLVEQVLKETGVKLSYMPFIIKAVSMALHEYPMLNASVNAEETEMTYHPRHNIGFATDTPHGLLVPNIKDCQARSVLEIAAELNRLHAAGLQNKLKPDELSGGTFSLSNIGAIGGTYASPVILPPQVSIGALGKIQKLPRFDANDNVVPVHIMCISWSADHRVIEGAQMARFSNKLKYYLENPASMLLHLK